MSVATPAPSVAILGGGPAGCYLAHQLAAVGWRVGLFAPRNRPPLLVGESMVPAIVPFLRKLGIEAEVAGYSILKPGATFTMRDQPPMAFWFREFARISSPYAYSSPRDLLDASFERAAVRTGARLFPFAGKVERAGADGVRLTAETLAATDGFFGARADWVIDATGRRRLLSGLLELPATVGPRRDVALFAHLEGMPLVSEGHTHSDLLEHGWAWRIPLPGRVSMGLVIDGKRLAGYGATSEEQFDNYLARDRYITQWSRQPKRITPVMRYTNYQLLSQRGVGDGWALVGDAFGFVDPVFSSGMMVGLDGAEVLARALVAGTAKALQAYEARVLRHVAAWHRAVARFYDGRLLSLFQVGAEVRDKLVGRILNRHFSRHFPQLFTGDASLRPYSSWLLEFMCKHGIRRKDPDVLRVMP